MAKKDAYKQHDELWRKYRQEAKIRADIVVVANGIERGVHLQIAQWDKRKRRPLDSRDEPSGDWRWNDTGPRNISTMREVALAILRACDFVEKSNPEWAKPTGGNKGETELEEIRKLVAE